MKIGLGIGIPFIRNYISSLFDPSKLFTGSTNGAWYDPSDINLTWRRNLLTYTEQFDNAAWVKAASTAPSISTTNPSGGATANKLTDTAASAFHYISQAANTVGTVSFSVYAKAAEKRWIVLYGLSVGVDAGAWFDLQTGIVGARQAYNLAATITSVGNGWYLCSIRFTGTQSGSAAIGLADADNTTTYTGNGTSGVYVWGAQLEVGSTATPYQRITDGIQDYLQYQAQPVLYRDAAGTLPVTAVEQPVGLMLDKSKGLMLGPELVTNGNFSTDTGWIKEAGWSIADGKAVFNGLANKGLIQNIGLTANVVGKVTIVVSSVTSGGLTVQFGYNTGTATITAPGTYIYTLSAGAFPSIYIVSVGTAQFAISSVSVKIVSGNHAFNSSGNSANFPVLSARYNLLTKTEQFDDAVWTKTAATLGSLVTAPDGSLTAQTVNFAGLTSEIKQTPSGTFSSTAFFAYVAVKGTAGETLNYGISSGADQVLTFNGQWQYINYTRTTSTPTLWFGTWSGATTRSFAVWHPDLRVANDALNQPAYQRVNTATDYDTVGFKPYLRFNGTNQWLQTNSIDFTYTDKMFVSAGVRKLSDAVQTVYELSANYSSNSGSFSSFINGGGASTNTIDAGLKGSGVNTYFSSSSYGTPISYVHSVSHNIAGTNRAQEIIPRINGVLNQSGGGGATDTGGGMFGNYPLYIGSRAGTSVWFNGRLYSLIVAGKLANAVEITETEKYVNGKTAAY